MNPYNSKDYAALRAQSFAKYRAKYRARRKGLYLRFALGFIAAIAMGISYWHSVAP